MPRRGGRPLADGKQTAGEARLKALRRRVRPEDPDARAIAQEVYEACVTLKPGIADDPLPLAVRGPLFAINVRAMEAIKVLHPGVVASEDDAMEVIAYLTELWCSGMIEFDRGHFATWRAKQDGEHGTLAGDGTQ